MSTSLKSIIVYYYMVYAGKVMHILTFRKLDNFCIIFCHLLDFFKTNFFSKKTFRNSYRQSVKQFGSRSDLMFYPSPMLCWAQSRFKLFAMVISRQQKSPLAGKEFRTYQHYLWSSNTLFYMIINLNFVDVFT